MSADNKPGRRSPSQFGKACKPLTCPDIARLVHRTTSDTTLRTMARWFPLWGSHFKRATVSGVEEKFYNQIRLHWLPKEFKSDYLFNCDMIAAFPTLGTFWGVQRIWVPVGLDPFKDSSDFFSQSNQSSKHFTFKEKGSVGNPPEYHRIQTRVLLWVLS